MHNLFTALLIGVVAGAIDALPMMIQKMDKMASLSAFTHYLVLGIIIPFVDWGISGWLTGLIIALLSAIPVMLMVLPKEKKAFYPMFMSAIFLGAGIGWIGEMFIK